MIKITVEAEARPTENVEKVKQAVRNIFAGDIIVQEQGNGYRLVKGISLTIDALKPLRDLARMQQVEPALKSYLYKHLENNTTILLLHKQAAYAGKLSLIDSEKESPLGPIRIIIEGDEGELNNLIEYLTGSP